MQNIQIKRVKPQWVALSALALGGLYYLYQHTKTIQKAGSLNVCGQDADPLVHDDLKQNRYLSQQLAERRALQIAQGSLSYNVDLYLKKGDSYQGLVNIQFRVNHVDQDLFLDYRGSQIDGLIINGVKQNNIQWNQLFIILPKGSLKLNTINEVQLNFTNKYQTDGTGLHSFIDTDGKQYLYSQGESYFCNRFFPCLDQPDIKGILKFKMIAPKEWSVISNENVEINQQHDFTTLQGLLLQQPKEWVVDVFSKADPQSYKIWVFGTTPLLPAYLYCIVAGEYWSIESQLPGIPQTIYCRESLKDHMLNIKDFIFEVTIKSLQFYESFFGVKFPFSKYDSLFVPEFNFGAMENPGCVTFNDSYIFREKKVASSYTSLANTISHEMSHMWFGNYVTMKWWNDLWLNESYADFISHFCLQHLDIKSIPLTDIGVLFNRGKGWGYRDDQMITTHPIAGDVPNTETAETIFDGITYSKGASVMKQLLCIMGADAFGRACGAHFKKYAWGNATLQDLINSLDTEFSQQGQKFTLKEWQEMWIQKAGLNEALPEWDSSDISQKATLMVHQTVALPNFPTLRQHKMKIAFFKEDGSIDVQDVQILNQAVTQIEYDGSQSYKAILLNYEDETFIKVLLDEVSLTYFRDNLHKIQDPLTRSMIWRAFFDVVRDSKISSEEYIKIVIKNLPFETADDIVSNQMGFLHAAVHAMTPKKYKKDLSTMVFHFIVQELKKIGTDSDPQSQNRMILFRDSLFSYTVDDQLIEQLISWRDHTNTDLKDVFLTNQSQWSIVQLVHASKIYQQEFKDKLLQEQSEKDKSDMSQRMQKRCFALAAEPIQLRQLWVSFLNSENKESAKLQSQSMSGFNNSRRYDDLVEYQDKFFDEIVDVFTNRSTDFAKSFYHNLFPITDDLAYLNKKLVDTLATTPVSQVTLRLELSKSLDSCQRKVVQFETFERRAEIARMKL